MAFRIIGQISRPYWQRITGFGRMKQAKQPKIPLSPPLRKGVDAGQFFSLGVRKSVVYSEKVAALRMSAEYR